VPALPKTAADFETSDVKELATLRDIVIKAKPANPVDADGYGTKVCRDFVGKDVGINSKKAEVRLHAAILIHDLNTLSTDTTLVQMLSSDDAAVRYWGARGLVDISGNLAKIGGTAVRNVVKALGDRAKVESSGIVQQEIVRALIQYSGFAPLLDALNATGDQMEAGIPDAALLETAALGLDFVGKSMGGAAAADKVKAATVAARAASYAAQQLKKNEEAVKTIDASATVPADYVAAVQRVVDGATKVAGAAAGKTYSVPTGTSSYELLMNVNGVFGTPGDRAGKLQGDLTGVPVPSKVKE
jgi:hypothetical protein